MPTANINGYRVDYVDAGVGLPVIFVPSLVGSKEWFRYQVYGLSDKYRILSYDPRGCSNEAGHNLEILAGELADFAAALKIHNVVVAGHGFGGLIALQFSLSYPGMCSGLILSSTAPSFAQISENDLISLMSPGEVKFESVLARFWKRLFGVRKAREQHEDPLAFLAKNSGNVDKCTLAARLAILRETDLTPRLERVNAATLIIAGSCDRPEILQGSQALEQHIRDAELEVIEDAGHFCFYTRHDLYNAIVDEFLIRNLPHF